MALLQPFTSRRVANRCFKKKENPQATRSLDHCRIWPIVETQIGFGFNSEVLLTIRNITFIIYVMIIQHNHHLKFSKMSCLAKFKFFD